MNQKAVTKRPRFENIVLFSGASAPEFRSIAPAGRSVSEREGRKRIESALRQRRRVRDICEELLGTRDVSISSHVGEGDTSRERRTVLPLAPIEALAVSYLNADEVSQITSRGGQVVENDVIRPMASVSTVELGKKRPPEADIWHLQELLQGRRREGAGQGIRIGVVDTGINARHREFTGQRVAFARVRRDVVRKEERPRSDDLDHGTGVASLIIGRNVGLSPGSELALCDVFDGEKGHRLDVLNGISWLLGNPFGDGRGINVLNLSVGLVGYDKFFLELVREAVELHGVAFVAAIGNDSHRSGPCTSPACYDEVLSVGAYDRFRNAAPFSNCGRALAEATPQPDIWAPGVDIRCASSAGGYRSVDGTSFAAPLAVAAIARLMSSDPALKARPADAVRHVVQQSASNPLLNPGNLMLRCSV